MDLNLCAYHDSFLLKSTKISSKCRYKCDFCDFYVHAECMNINITSRHKHPLQLRPCDINFLCCLCDTRFSKKNFYQCSRCSFRICIPCARKPLTIHRYKTHEHTLHQILMKISFTCDACGLCSTGYPYICHQCCFIIHRLCIFLPRVICINHHDHRISHVFSLGLGKFICGVCDEPVNVDCGAYSCLTCSSVFHSKCATDPMFWDEKELEGIPEEEESKPLEVIDQNLIKHFNHEHNLMKLSVSSLRHGEVILPHEEGKHCFACTLPLYSKLCYKCTQCDFILHDTCANLPRSKWFFLIYEKLTLSPKSRNHFFCYVCHRYCNGFSYSNSENTISIDVRCASVPLPLKHESHPHKLVFYDNDQKDVRCEGCDLSGWRFLLHCKGNDDCGGLYLCFKCATLPTLVRHIYDDHLLSLYYGEKNESSTYWCGICEELINSNSWFYKCNDCGSTLHTTCVFQNLILSRPGYNSTMEDLRQITFVLNTHLSRPICYVCKTRCMDDLVLIDKEESIKLFVCYSCSFKNYKGPRFVSS
ncbi:hypothetical protein BRARA_D01070 [Brassica rapa]|uniref:Phorbol-ester/DAG-type domain-containing protein n=1 Tax=Brassica campestris TaxID=3711 RepID=A0A397ZLM0_BRACM|nr:hypothetical protein BRARA_D01070 [Brassica rapa]